MLNQLRDLIEGKEELDDIYDATVCSHPLATAYLKVLRADENLETLNTLFQRFLETEPYSFRSHLDVTSGKYFLLPNIRSRFLDKWWGVALGDVVHDLRSALDHATFQLSCDCQNVEPTSNLPRQWKDVGFPIFDSESLYDNGGPNGRPRPASSFIWAIADPGLLALIKTAQPFSGRPEAPREHPLWVLHELWNIDKHRTVNLGSVVVKRFEIEVPGLPEPVLIDPGTPVEPDTPVATWEHGGPLLIQSETQVEMKSRLALEVAFGRGAPGEGRGVRDVLTAARTLIVKLLDEMLDTMG